MKTLSKEKGKRLWGGIGNNSGSGGVMQGAQGGGDSQEVMDARYLRKDKADTAKGIITFTKGLVSVVAAWLKEGFSLGNDDTYNVQGTGDAHLRDTGVRNLNVSQNATVTGNATVEGNEEVAGTNSAFVIIAKVLGDIAYKTKDFVTAVGMIGKGFGVTTDADGKATLQTDDLLVLGRMIVNSLNIREVTYIGGTYLLTPAGSTVAKVMPLYSTGTPTDTRTWRTYGSGTIVGYRVLWKADDGTTYTMNYWQPGDQAFCQTFNITEPGEYTNAENRRYWRMVCRVGQSTITESDGSTTKWHYCDLANIASVYLYDSDNNAITNVRTGGTAFPGFEGSLATSHSVPAEGDKVVCLGSQAQVNRQGAIQLTAEGTSSMGIYDGINDFKAISNYEIHFMSKEQVRMTANKFFWKSGNTLETQESVNTRISTAEGNITTVSRRVDDVETSVSTIEQTADRISLSVESGYQNYVIKPRAVDAKLWTLTSGTIYNNDPIFGTYRRLIYTTSNATWQLLFDGMIDSFENLRLHDVTFFMIVRHARSDSSYPYDTISFGSVDTDSTPNADYKDALKLSFVDGSLTVNMHAGVTKYNYGDVGSGVESIGNGWYKVWFTFFQNENTWNDGDNIGINSMYGQWDVYACGITSGKGCPSVAAIVENAGLQSAGIDITKGVIDLIAGRVNFIDPDGNKNTKVWISTADGTLHAVNGDFSGVINLKAMYTQIQSPDFGDTINPENGACFNLPLWDFHTPEKTYVKLPPLSSYQNITLMTYALPSPTRSVQNFAKIYASGDDMIMTKHEFEDHYGTCKGIQVDGWQGIIKFHAIGGYWILETDETSLTYLFT